MQISHLVHDARCIRCTRCQKKFEMPRRSMTDPHRLVEAKESIAAKHVCVARRAKVIPIRVANLTPLFASQHDDYWRKAVSAAQRVH